MTQESNNLPGEVIGAQRLPQGAEQERQLTLDAAHRVLAGLLGGEAVEAATGQQATGANSITGSGSSQKSVSPVIGGGGTNV